MTALVTKGQELSYIEFIDGGECVGKFRLISSTDVEKKGIRMIMLEFIDRIKV